MVQVREGRVGALGTLFERHHSKLFCFCLRMTGNRAVSEDLVQDIFMRMLKYRKSFNDGRPFTPWMFRLARNACIDHLRRPPSEDSTAFETMEPESSDITAHDRLEREDSVGILRRALLELPVDRREVLVLSRFESMNYDDIARLLDCSVGAVKVRVHRAVRQLRQIYLTLTSEAAS